MTQRVAILGLGTMGMGMAKNLLKAGFTVTAYNRTSAKAAPLAAAGARIAETPADAAREADIILSMNCNRRSLTDNADRRGKVNRRRCRSRKHERNRHAHNEDNYC